MLYPFQQPSAVQNTNDTIKIKKKNKKNLYWFSLSRLQAITCKCSLNCNYYSVISLVIVKVSNVGELRYVR